MLNLVLWILLLAALVGLIAFAWRSASRRRGFRLVGLLDRQEKVSRYAVDVSVSRSERPESERRVFWRRRGTLILTDQRLAGFSHRTRFVIVRGGEGSPGVSARGDWVVIRPAAGKRSRPRVIAYRVGWDAEAWANEARQRILRGRRSG